MTTPKARLMERRRQLYQRIAAVLEQHDTADLTHPVDMERVCLALVDELEPRLK